MVATENINLRTRTAKNYLNMARAGREYEADPFIKSVLRVPIQEKIEALAGQMQSPHEFIAAQILAERSISRDYAYPEGMDIRKACVQLTVGQPKGYLNEEYARLLIFLAGAEMWNTHMQQRFPLAHSIRELFTQDRNFGGAPYWTYMATSLRHLTFLEVAQSRLIEPWWPFFTLNNIPASRIRDPRSTVKNVAAG